MDIMHWLLYLVIHCTQLVSYPIFAFVHGKLAVLCEFIHYCAA